MICRVLDAEILVAEAVVEFQVGVAVFLEQEGLPIWLEGPNIGLVADRKVQLVIHEDPCKMKVEVLPRQRVDDLEPRAGPTVEIAPRKIPNLALLAPDVLFGHRNQRVSAA